MYLSNLVTKEVRMYKKYLTNVIDTAVLITNDINICFSYMSRSSKEMDLPWSDGIYPSDVPRDFEEVRNREDRKERISLYWESMV